jgi:tetratricopeptide (TPR) repeat protein
MHRLLSVVVVVGSVVGMTGRVHAERRLNTLGQRASLGACQAAAGNLADALAVDAKSKLVLEHRCVADHWTSDTALCFTHVETAVGARLCLDTLSKVQRKAVEGDADRLADVRLARWLMHRAMDVRATPTVVTFASYNASTGSIGTARTLYTKAMSAYQAGHYDVASKSFTAAMNASPTADSVYLAAQSYRLKGDRAKALELYLRYLEIAPSGPAASSCRYQIERLRDSHP